MTLRAVSEIDCWIQKIGRGETRPAQGPFTVTVKVVEDPWNDAPGTRADALDQRPRWLGE